MNEIELLLAPLKNGRVAESNTVKNILVGLHDTYGRSFREIQALPEFGGIPLRTLHSIYSGKRDIPKKHRARFNLPELIPVPACPIPNCDDPTHQHKHGERAVPVDAPVYNPETQRVIKKSTKPRKKTQRRRDVEVWLF